MLAAQLAAPSYRRGRHPRNSWSIHFIRRNIFFPPMTNRVWLLDVFSGILSSLNKQFKPQMNTDGHRSEGVANEPTVTRRVKDVSQRNLCSSVFICGFRL